MRIKLYINPAAAVRAGRSTSGDAEMSITDDMIASLSSAQREELATHVSSSRDRLGGSNDPAISCDSWDQCVAVLQYRAEERQRAEKAAAAEAAARTARTARLLAETNATFAARKTKIYRGEVVPAWPYHAPADMIKHILDSDEGRAWMAELKRQNQKRAEKAAAARAAAEAAKEQKRAEKAAAQKNLEAARAAWIGKHGTESQKERYAAGLLPAAELDDAIRNQLFAAGDRLSRYARIVAEDLPCECCYEEDCNVCFDVDESEELSERQWEALKSIRGKFPGAKITPRIHRAEREECEQELCRWSALVKINWHGGAYSREYALPDAG